MPNMMSVINEQEDESNFEELINELELEDSDCQDSNSNPINNSNSNSNSKVE